jgi:hypothetical protein
MIKVLDENRVVLSRRVFFIRRPGYGSPFKRAQTINLQLIETQFRFCGEINSNDKLPLRNVKVLLPKRTANSGIKKYISTSIQ